MGRTGRPGTAPAPSRQSKGEPETSSHCENFERSEVLSVNAPRREPNRHVLVSNPNGHLSVGCNRRGGSPAEH